MSVFYLDYGNVYQYYRIGESSIQSVNFSWYREHMSSIYLQNNGQFRS